MWTANNSYLEQKMVKSPLQAHQGPRALPKVSREFEGQILDAID
jgi:hypothetical protein